MRYKGTNKIYFGIGIRDDYARFNNGVFFFYWFKLIKKPTGGVALTPREHYIGFNIEKDIIIPNFSIEL